MRDTALAAMDRIVCHANATAESVSAYGPAFEVMIPPLATALTKSTVGRLELLQWLIK